MRIEINMSLAEGLTLHTAAMNQELPLFVGYHDATHICWIEMPDESLNSWRAARHLVWDELVELSMPMRRVRRIVNELWFQLNREKKKEESAISRFIKGEV